MFEGSIDAEVMRSLEIEDRIANLNRDRPAMEVIVNEFIKENTKYLEAEVKRLSEEQDILSKKIQILDERTKLPKPSVPTPSYQVECPYLPAGQKCPGFKKKSGIRRLIEYISR